MAIRSGGRKLQLLFFCGCLALLCSSSGCTGVKGGNETDPPTASLTASPSAVDAGQTSTLSWSSQNASTLSIDPGMPSVSSSGSLQIRPVKTTTYTLTANGAGGTARTTATVTVQPAPPSKSTLSGVLTYHNNTARTGQNLGETALNPGNVNSEN